MVSVIITNNAVSMGLMPEKALSMKMAMVSVITMLPEDRMVPAAGEAVTATETMDIAATEEAVTGDNNEGIYAERTRGKQGSLPVF